MNKIHTVYLLALHQEISENFHSEERLQIIIKKSNIGTGKNTFTGINAASEANISISLSMLMNMSALKILKLVSNANLNLISLSA